MTFHLVASLMTPGHFRNAWRLSHVDPRATLDVDWFRALAQEADEVGLDAIFVGDAPALSPEIATHPANGIDPLVLLGHLAAVTRRVGVLATASTTYNSPYNLARRFQALDLVSKGRAAVNLVTTFSGPAAANFGFGSVPEKAERYRRAYEFVEVLHRLWDGWSADAVVADKEKGVWADPARIKGAEHQGEFFSVAGALPTPAGPQGRPVVCQAGGSEGGLRLGSELADVIFTVAQTQEKAVAFRDDIRARAVAAGREADEVKVSVGVIVLIGTDEADARARFEELYATVDEDEIAARTLALLGLTGRGLDEPIAATDLPENPVGEQGSVGFQVSTRAMLAAGPLTARQLVRRTAGVAGGGHRLLVGTPEQIADDLQSWFEAGAGDGFTVMYADIAVDFTRFARLVVPILVERGLFTPAEEGSTLRDRWGLPYPEATRQDALLPV